MKYVQAVSKGNYPGKSVEMTVVSILRDKKFLKGICM
jgi:hypothetical protein